MLNLDGNKHVLPVMERQLDAEGEGGAIVNVFSIASMSFQIGGRVHVAYAAFKGGYTTATQLVIDGGVTASRLSPSELPAA